MEKFICGGGARHWIIGLGSWLSFLLGNSARPKVWRARVGACGTCMALCEPRKFSSRQLCVCHQRNELGRDTYEPRSNLLWRSLNQIVLCLAAFGLHRRCRCSELLVCEYHNGNRAGADFCAWYCHICEFYGCEWVRRRAEFNYMVHSCSLAPWFTSSASLARGRFGWLRVLQTRKLQAFLLSQFEVWRRSVWLWRIAW